MSKIRSNQKSQASAEHAVWVSGDECTDTKLQGLGNKPIKP